MRSEAHATPEEIQDIAAGLPRLGEITGKRYVPMFAAEGSELVIFEDGIPVLRYLQYPSLRMDGPRTRAIDGKDWQERPSTIEKFLERMKGHRHLIGFFGDDLALSRLIELKFLAMGLVSGESTAYILPASHDGTEPADIRAEMRECLSSHLQDREKVEKMMRRFQSFNLDSAVGDAEAEIAEASRTVRDALAQGGKPPYRLVVHNHEEIVTPSDLEAHIATENAVHQGFERFEGTFLCNHYSRLVNLEPRLFHLWLRAVARSRDYAFYTVGNYDVYY